MRELMGWFRKKNERAPENLSEHLHERWGRTIVCVRVRVRHTIVCLYARACVRARALAFSITLFLTQ